LILNRNWNWLKAEDFNAKLLRIATYDKPFYNNQDIGFMTIRDFIKDTFIERVDTNNKKQLLSSKEKEVDGECGRLMTLTLIAWVATKTFMALRRLKQSL